MEDANNKTASKLEAAIVQVQRAVVLELFEVVGMG